MTELTQIPIDVASTKPAMALGIPLEFWVVAMAIFAWVGILLGWKYEGFVVAAALAVLVPLRRDHNAPRVFLLWLRGAAFDMDTKDMGGTSVPVIAEDPQHEFRGIA